VAVKDTQPCSGWLLSNLGEGEVWGPAVAVAGCCCNSCCLWWWWWWRGRVLLRGREERVLLVGCEGLGVGWLPGAEEMMRGGWETELRWDEGKEWRWS